MLKKFKKGLAAIEFVVSFFVFIFTIAVFYASFGVVHASILNSIAARNYAFSVISNRSDINYHRDYSKEEARLMVNGAEGRGYFNKDVRFFAKSEYQKGGEPDWKAPSLSIDFQLDLNRPGALGLDPEIREPEGISSLDFNRAEIGGDLKKAREGELNTTLVYLKQGYGICLNADCGGD